MLFRQTKTHHILILIFLSVLVLSVSLGWQQMVARAESLKVQETEVQQPVADLYSDYSLQKYLSADTPFSDVKYVPVDLVSIDSNFTANNPSKFSLRSEAAVQFADMAWHFWNDEGGARLYVASAYRSPGLQQYLFNKGCSSARCAQVGSSEHQAGLAVDLKVVTKGGKAYSLNSGNIYYQWLADNASKRGFHNTYQKGIEVDGQMVEGWHWRYVGSGLAIELQVKGQTFAELFKEKNMEAKQIVMNN